MAPLTGQSSGKPRPSRISADGFALAGPSKLPDRDFNAYRKDLADLALAGTVIASHYAEPLPRHILAKTPVFADPSESSPQIRDLEAGEAFLMLDDSFGWAWGYAGADKRVGYVHSACVGD